MRTPPFRRTTAVLLLLLAAVLAAPPASAADRPAEAVSLSPQTLLDHLWSFLRAAWSKEGCTIGPDGLCKPGTTSPPAAQTKDGCNIDPSGHCKP
jgi:ABC-type sugar transport system substrate-binding protein